MKWLSLLTNILLIYYYTFLVFSYHLGNSVFFPLMLAYNMKTDDEDNIIDITNSIHPYNKVGQVQIAWTPLPGLDGKSVTDD